MLRDMLSVINKKEGQEMKRMESDRNALPRAERVCQSHRKGLLKNILQHRKPNGHVSARIARCHCHPLSTVGWPQTPDRNLTLRLTGHPANGVQDAQI